MCRKILDERGGVAGLRLSKTQILGVHGFFCSPRCDLVTGVLVYVPHHSDTKPRFLIFINFNLIFILFPIRVFIITCLYIVMSLGLLL